MAADDVIPVFVFKFPDYVDQPLELFLCSGNPNEVDLKIWMSRCHKYLFGSPFCNEFGSI